VTPRSLNLFVLALLVAAVTRAESGIGGPIAGVVLDTQARALRPINGIPGSSLLGSPINTAAPIRRAELSPSGRAALIVSDGPEGEVLLVRGLLGAGPTVVPVNGSIPNPDLISWAANGSVAAMYSRRGAEIQLTSGLDSSPQILPPIALPHIDGEITAVTLTSDQSFVLFAAFDGSRGAVSRLDLRAPYEIVTLLTLSGKPEAIDLVNGERDLVIADSRYGDVWYITDIRGARRAFTVASAKDGLMSPVSLRVIENGRMLIGDTGNNVMVVLDLSTLTVIKRIQLTATPGAMRGSTDGETVVVTDELSGRVLLVDPTQEAVYFVPVSR
jgi:hypothetical protein